MGTTLHLPALVTLATLLLLFGCAAYVGKCRVRYKVSAPATTGPVEFERAFRVQMNTLENVVIFLPALWLAAIYSSPRVAAAVGAVWVLARVWYAVAYARDAKKRGNPFVIAYTAWAVLMALAAWGILTSPLW
jgi:hypothetical protein